MRATMFALGLASASNAASAQAIDTTQTAERVTLTNGCVYAQNQLAQGNEWSLIYTQAGTQVQCPLTIFGLTAQTTRSPAIAPEPAVFNSETALVTRTQAAPDYVPRPRVRINPHYIVGVFR